jgi:hypothetical protein
MTALSTLLAIPHANRSAPMHEHTFDAFIAFAGGARADEALGLTPNDSNADYFILRPNGNIAIELKQIHGANEKGALTPFLAERGSRPEELVDLSKHRQIGRQFRPAVLRHAKKASRQLKETTPLLRAKFGGNWTRMAWFLVTGDLDLNTEVLTNVMHREAQENWRRGRLRGVDFMFGSEWDQVGNPNTPLPVLPERLRYHPAGSFALRSSYHLPAAELAIEAGWFLEERWLAYLAEAVGSKVATKHIYGGVKRSVPIPRPLIEEGVASSPDTASIPLHLRPRVPDRARPLA